MKHYLAFKGVADDLTSAWMGHDSVNDCVSFKLKRQYKIGKTLRSSHLFPMYLMEHLGVGGWSETLLSTGCRNSIKRIVLVRVPANHVSLRVPFFTIRCNNEPYFSTLADIANNSHYSYGIGATRLTVLCEVVMNEHVSADAAMRHFEKLYNTPRIPQTS